MKKLVVLFVVLGLVSCKKEYKNIVKPQNKNGEKVWVSKNQKFLDKFKTIDFDTLEVFSEVDVYSDKYRFKGNLLQPSDSIYFPKNISIFDVRRVAAYSVYKFNIDTKNIALITRVGGEYDATSIKIFNYSKEKEMITDYRELAENWGDAGDTFDKKSWIFRKDNCLEFFTRVKFEHDNSIDEDPNSSSFKENHYFLLGFKEGKFDTINKNNKKLEKQFSKIIKKENQK